MWYKYCLWLAMNIWAFVLIQLIPLVVHNHRSKYKIMSKYFVNSIQFWFWEKFARVASHAVLLQFLRWSVIFSARSASCLATFTSGVVLVLSQDLVLWHTRLFIRVLKLGLGRLSVLESVVILSMEQTLLTVKNSLLR